jgi:hypothetical protein
MWDQPREELIESKTRKEALQLKIIKDLNSMETKKNMEEEGRNSIY